MPLDMTNVPRWLGRYPILDTADADELEMGAGVHQLLHGMQRPHAEAKSYEEYKHHRIVQAAAHHLNGMVAAHAIGNNEAAVKHGTMYALALKALKHDDPLTPPDEVAKAAKNTPDQKGFKAHKADLFTTPQLPGEDPHAPKQNEKQVKEAAMAKSEEASHETTTIDVPVGHRIGMRVPEGGSSCAKCEFVSEDGNKCGDRLFQVWNKGPDLPAPANEYCCDYFTIKGKKE